MAKLIAEPLRAFLHARTHDVHVVEVVNACFVWSTRFAVQHDSHMLRLVCSLLSRRHAVAGGVADSGGGTGGALQAAHQRLCAVLLVKLVRLLLQLRPADLAAQLARCA